MTPHNAASRYGFRENGTHTICMLREIPTIQAIGFMLEYIILLSVAYSSAQNWVGVYTISKCDLPSPG